MSQSTVNHRPLLKSIPGTAIIRLKNGKAPGICFFQHFLELLKAGGSSGAEWLTAVCARAWTTGHIPDDWRRGVILPSKGDMQRFFGC